MLPKTNPLKKIILTLAFAIIAITTFAQSIQKPQLFKYVTTAPDGSVTLTVIDDSRHNMLKLEAATNFHKYQLLDIKTGETVFTSANKGKTSTIDKSKLTAGIYNLRVYTKKFVITSEIPIGVRAIETQGNTVVSIE